MDRLIAALRTPATASFLSALADSCGCAPRHARRARAAPRRARTRPPRAPPAHRADVSTVLMYLGRDVASKFGHVSYSGLLITLSCINLLVTPLCVGACLHYYRPYLGAAPAPLKEARVDGALQVALLPGAQG